MSACLIRGVDKVYGEPPVEVMALRGVDLVIERGEFLVLAGPSGSGKTTLLNLIGLLDAPTRGTVAIDGVETGGLPSRALAKLRAGRIGFVFQSFNLVPVLSAAENVELALQLAGRSGPEQRDLVRKMLAAVGLKGFEDRLPRQLSGGQQQRVAIARALVKEPALVIADEPTANLDSHTGGEVLDLMHRMNRELGVTFVFSTHDPMVMQAAQRIVRLKDGAIVGDERCA